MIGHKKALTFATIAAFVFHGAAFFVLHQTPLKSAPHTYSHSFAWIEQQQLVEKKERSKLLAHVFDSITPQKPLIKEKLHELSFEFAPAYQVTFPEGEPQLVPKEGFAVAIDLFDLTISDECSHSFLAGSSLINTSPFEVQSDLPQLTSYSQGEELGTIAASPHFDYKVEYVQKQQRPGYVFKVTFFPKPDVAFKRIQQNYFFLIDRSNSIPRHRFAINKQIVGETLAHLKPGDTFNILFFDDKVKKLSEQSLPMSAENIDLALAFLEEHNHGGYFAATELYSSLGKIIPQDVSDHELNTAILLSDGDTFLPHEKQRTTIGQWTHENGGKVALYTVASGKGNNLPLLDLISAFNKGALIHTSNHHDLKERLASLIRTIRNPIGKKMLATAITSDAQMHILLQPKRARMPELYQNRPFIVYGSTNKLGDFSLFLQGNYYDTTFDIKKNISFEGAQPGTYQMEHTWNQLCAQEFYERFFEDGNSKHLDQIKQLLLPKHTPLPFIHAYHRR